MEKPMATATEMVNALLDFVPTVTELDLDQDSLVAAMATPGDYKLTVPMQHRDRMVRTLRRMVDANGLRCVSKVMAQHIYMEVKAA